MEQNLEYIRKNFDDTIKDRVCLMNDEASDTNITFTSGRICVDNG